MFTSAAHHFSFARAAKDVTVIPPEFTLVFMGLEEKSDLSPFSRSMRKLSLTTAGELPICMVGSAVYFVPCLMAPERIEPHT